MVEFTILSQISFLIQFLITFVVTIYLYGKYKTDWLSFEKFFFGFFVFITLSNFIAIFFIIDQGLEFAFVNIFSFLSTVLLLIAGFTLMGVHNKIVLYTYPMAIFAIDAVMNLLHGLKFPGITEGIYRAVTGIDALLIIIPAILIYAFLTFKTRDTSLLFFSIALIFYIFGGFTVSRGEIYMAIFFNLAVICFVIATVLPIIKNRRLKVNSAPT